MREQANVCPSGGVGGLAQASLREAAALRGVASLRGSNLLARAGGRGGGSVSGKTNLKLETEPQKL